MPDIGEYRAHAAECVRLAQQTSDPQSKSSLLDMARAWLALITQSERNSEATTLVYETPEPTQHAAQQQQQPRPDEPSRALLTSTKKWRRNASRKIIDLAKELGAKTAHSR
jgi:hypothetical protein